MSESVAMPLQVWKSYC